MSRIETKLRRNGLVLSRALALSGAVFIAAYTAANAGPPYRTDDPVPAEYGHAEIYAFSAGTDLRGDISGDFIGFDVNYGALPNVQLTIVASLAFDAPDDHDFRYGSGDTELGVKYRFLNEDGWQASLYPQIVLPTGDAHRGLGTGHTDFFLPLWLEKDFGPWTTYGGGGYWINEGPERKNSWFAGWLLQRQVTEQLALGGEVFHQTSGETGGKDSTGFNFGGIYNLSEHYALLLSAGSGMQNAQTTNAFSYYIALELTY